VPNTLTCAGFQHAACALIYFSFQVKRDEYVKAWLWRARPFNRMHYYCP